MSISEMNQNPNQQAHLSLQQIKGLGMRPHWVLGDEQEFGKKADCENRSAGAPHRSEVSATQRVLQAGQAPAHRHGGMEGTEQSAKACRRQC